MNAESWELASRYEEVFGEAEAADARIRPELMQSTVEVATKPARSVAEAIAETRELRRRLRDEAEARGYVVAAAGTHPFSRWEHQEITDRPRYAELIEALQWSAARQLIFGLHVHVGLDSAQQAVAVAGALRTWLPELLAVSANSPFWHGRDTGLASARSKVFDTMPRSGLPPAFASFEEFELLVERGIKTGSFSDYTYIWWDLRPHPRLGTIEVRICDAQTRIDSVAALLALVQSLVATLAERYGREGSLPIQPITLISENKWRAPRNGRAVLPPATTTPMTLYRQPERGRRTGLQLVGRIVLWLLIAVLVVAAGLLGGAYLYFHEQVKAVQAHTPDVIRAEKGLDVPQA